jgi:double-stranded uracil-DNA glycosylase
MGGGIFYFTEPEENQRTPDMRRDLFARVFFDLRCWMLPDYLAPHLDIVFVGLNPGMYSDQVGHYFARKRNMFWTALRESGIVPRPLEPGDDVRILDFRLGLTDLVKRATHAAGELNRLEFRQGGEELRAKLAPLEPRVVCFVGLMGYRAAFDAHAGLGAQISQWGSTRLFVVPSTSARNARYRNEMVGWFEKLRTFLEQTINT